MIPFSKASFVETRSIAGGTGSGMGSLSVKIKLNDAADTANDAADTCNWNIIHIHSTNVENTP
jgi:hypothetical protein